MDNNIRNIVLVGRTGVGKSTIGNCLLNKKEFKESELSVSCTKDAKLGNHLYNEIQINLSVVDTIGIGDTDLDEKAVMIKISNTVRKFNNGINGIFFVFDGRFTHAEVTAYNLITKILFPDCTNQLYLIRNRFKYCTDVNKCKNDIEALKQDNFTAQIFNDVKTDHLIYVDSNEEVMDRYNYTHTCLLSLINKLDNIYLSLPYKEIVKKN